MLVIPKNPGSGQKGGIKQRYFAEIDEPGVCDRSKGTRNNFNTDGKNDKHQHSAGNISQKLVQFIEPSGYC